MVEILMMVRRLDGRDDVLKVFTYIVDAKVPFLCGKRTLEGWNSRLNTGNRVLKTIIDGERKDFRMVDTGSNHFGVIIEKEDGNVEKIMYAEGKKEELDTFKAIRKVHEATSHKSADQLVNVYRNA